MHNASSGHKLDEGERPCTERIHHVPVTSGTATVAHRTSTNAKKQPKSSSHTFWTCLAFSHFHSKNGSFLGYFLAFRKLFLSLLLLLLER